MQKQHIAAIIEKVLRGERIDDGEALFLHQQADLSTLAFLADTVRRRLHGGDVVTYIVDRNINPTNICTTRCSFCAFYRDSSASDAYVLPRETIYAKVRELVEAGGVLILMQGGHHPDLRVQWFADLIRAIKERFPVHVHGMSPPEIHHLARIEKTAVSEILRRLRDAGMDSMPGGGAEILSDRVRRIIAPRKCSADEWIQVSRSAHELGLRTTATMMYGHVETPAERIEHLRRLRDLQDETGGFTAFACWNFQSAHTQLDAPMTTHAEYYRMVSLARIYLDNIENIQTSFVTQGIAAAQISLRLGVNDFGGGMMEENVVSSAGCHQLASLNEIERHIRAAGFTPRRRNFFYEIIDERRSA